MVRRAAQATERGRKGLPRDAGRPENLRRGVQRRRQGAQKTPAEVRRPRQILARGARQRPDGAHGRLRQRAHQMRAVAHGDADGRRGRGRERANTLTFSGIERPRRLRRRIIHLRRGDGERGGARLHGGALRRGEWAYYYTRTAVGGYGGSERRGRIKNDAGQRRGGEWEVGGPQVVTRMGRRSPEEDHERRVEFASSGARRPRRARGTRSVRPRCRSGCCSVPVAGFFPTTATGRAGR